MTTVSAIAVVDLANTLLSREIICEKNLSFAVLNELSLYGRGESIVEHRLPETELVSLWNSINPNSELAFEMACTVNPKAKGILANWISHSDTLAQAFSIFRGNIALLNQSEYWQLDNQSNQVVLEFCFRSDLKYPNIAIERSMVAIIAWANYLSSGSLRVTSASFVYQTPDHVHAYESIFGKKLYFQSKANRIVINKSDFNRKLNTANPYIREILHQRSKDIGLFQPRKLTVIGEVQARLLQNLPFFSSIEHTMTDLNMSRATLYRKLKMEGSTFSELLIQTRMKKFHELKPLKLDSAQLAELLGFSDVSSYYRFVKRHKLS